MYETPSNKTRGLALTFAIMVVVAGIIAAGIYFRQSQRLQVRLDGTTRELEQTKSESERIKSASGQATRDLPMPRHQGSAELCDARLRLANMRTRYSARHPAVQEQIRKIADLERAQ